MERAEDAGRAKTILLAVAVIAVVVYICLPLGARWSPPKEATVIELWHPWGGDFADAFAEVVEEFNRTHPHIYARTLFTPNDLANSTKFYIAVAGGVPPDVSFVDGPQVAEWANMGVLQPLDEFVAEARITPDDFWQPCWKQCCYDGKVWALTFVADTNFAMVWNKQVLREAGLPDRAPRTINELNDWCRRLYVENPTDHSIERLGLIPWRVFGSANSMFTWGWCFGGRFFDYEHSKVTADDAKVVKALEWMVRFADEYGLDRINALASTFGNDAQQPFFTGKIAMDVMHNIGVQYIPRYAPDLEYGVGPLPAPPDGEQDSSWVGGWAIAIPKGTRGNERAAFEFIRWMCASQEGTYLIAKSMRVFPGYKKCRYFDEIRRGNDHVLKVFLSILEKCKHQRPVMPAQAKYMHELDRAVSFALYKDLSPLQALRRARQNTQTHLDKVLSRENTRNEQTN